MSLAKREELSHQYARAYSLTEENARLLMQIGEVNSRVGELEERDLVREEEQAQAHHEHDLQRAIAEHKA